MGYKVYLLCGIKETTNSGYYIFYDTGFSNYKFIALLNTALIVLILILIPLSVPLLLRKKESYFSKTGIFGIWLHKVYLI